MIEQNPEAPHKTIVWLVVKTYELLKTGECNGTPVMDKELILEINGNNKEEVVSKTIDFIERIKNVKSRSEAV